MLSSSTHESRDFWELSVINSDSNEYHKSYYNDKTDSTLTTNHIGLPAGTCYIRITNAPYQLSTADYRLKVNFTACVRDYLWLT